MRIAISGTHFSGKSTLISSLVKRLPSYISVDEPYFLLEEEGFLFSDPPSLEDFEQQFKRSIMLVEESGVNTIFDRSPIDFLVYALVLSEKLSLGGEIGLEYWVQEMEEAIQMLDLIFFLPIEYRDRIPVPPTEDIRFRENVNEKFQEILLDDSLGVLEGVKVLEITGDLVKRVDHCYNVLHGVTE